MFRLAQHKWFRRLSFAAIAALGLGAAAIPTAPAQAAVRLFAGPGGFSIAIVQHPHHDWWRQPYGYDTGYYRRGSGYDRDHDGYYQRAPYYGHGWYR